MKRSTIVLSLLCLMTGCASKMETAYVVHTGFNSTVTSLNTARENHLIDDGTQVKINAQEHAVSPLLDDLDTAAIKADANNLSLPAALDFNSIESHVLSELTVLSGYKPTTQPAR